MVLRHLGEALAVPELGPELSFRETEVAGRGIEAAEEAEVTKAPARAADDREVIGLDACLQGVAFRLCDASRSDCSVDVIGQRLLEGVAELVGRDAELSGRVVDDCLALFARGVALRRGHRGGAPAGGRHQGGGSDDVFTFPAQLHFALLRSTGRSEPAPSKNALRTA